jgi:hypothetical protein
VQNFQNNFFRGLPSGLCPVSTSRYFRVIPSIP